jgi:hypothetical protein
MRVAFPGQGVICRRDLEGKTWMGRAFLLGALLLCSAAANAEIVTFDDVPFGNSPTPLSGAYVEGGVSVTSVGGKFWAYSGPGELHFDPADAGTENSAFDFTYAGGTFDLVSFDVVFAEGFWGAFLQGFDQNGFELSNLFVTNFGTIPVEGFDDLYTLRITAFGDPGDHFSIDNLTISTPVPEPGTWLTMLLGFGAIGYGFRRSRTGGLSGARPA